MINGKGTDPVELRKGENKEKKAEGDVVSQLAWDVRSSVEAVYKAYS